VPVLALLASVTAAGSSDMGGPRAALAEEKPLWELGIGASALTLPDYTGSEHQRYIGVPFPYIVYRGEWLRADRQSIRGRLWTTDRFRLVVSVNGSLPVDSDDRGVRAGMPDLDPTIELGPELRVILYEGHSRGTGVQLELPVRSVFATDFTYVDHEGWRASPAIRAKRDFGQWNLQVIAGPQFSDRSYHDYIYGVDARFGTPERAAWEADGGYAGSRIGFGASRSWRRFRFGTFFRYANIAGATFDDSPLVETDHSFIAGFAVAWVFAKSKTMVEVGGEREGD
jgi:outer membrane scaffolding protein for murein synthesis (MipA/OmpV family)